MKRHLLRSGALVTTRRDEKILGRYLRPPYLGTSVRKDVLEFMTSSARKRLSGSSRYISINKKKRYWRYLETRYPVLGLEPNSINQLLADGQDAVESCLKEALARHEGFVRQQRKEIALGRKDFLKRKQQCLVCSFDLVPLLEVHHIVALEEGGDNRLVTVLCPNCHRLFERLTRLKSKVKQHGLWEFNWWLEQQRATDWGTKANQKINVIVDLCLEHLECRNFDTFLREHVLPKAAECPSVCLDFPRNDRTIIKALPNL